MSICEYFNCDSMESLLDKLISKDSSVKELSDFLDKMIKDKAINKTITLNSPDSYYDFFQKEKCLASGDDVLVLYTNIKINLVYYETVKLSKLNHKDIMKRLYEHNASNVVFQYNGDTKYDVRKINQLEQIEHNLNKININVHDRFCCTKGKYLHSEKGYKDYLVSEETFKNNKKRKSFHKIQRKKTQFSTYKDYDEIIEKYVTREITGLNAIKDEDKIKELIKLLSSHRNKELMHLIKYDNDYNVTHIKELFKGNRGNIKLNIATLFLELYQYDAKNISLIHNHPSGDYVPSNDDISTTIKMNEVLQDYDFNLLEHYISAKGGVYCISEDISELRDKKEGISYLIKRKYREQQVQQFLKTYTEYTNHQFGNQDSVDSLLLDFRNNSKNISSLGLAYTEYENEIDGHINEVQTVVDLYRMEYKGYFNDQCVEIIKFDSIDEIEDFVKNYDFESGVQDVYEAAINGHHQEKEKGHEEPER